MNDTNSVIDSLRIDRSAPMPQRNFGNYWIFGAALLAIAGAFWWYFHGKAESLPVQAAVVVSASAAAISGSTLEATGYVVANRQATVAAKVTGRLVSVMFEEGQHVKAGQVLAKLDDTNAAAVMNEARAQVDLAKTTLKGKEALWQISQRLLVRQKQLQANGWVSVNAVDSVAATGEGQLNDVQVAKGQLAVYEAALVSAQRNVEDTIVRAPFDGVVTVKAAQPGEIISPSSGGGGFTRTGICTLVAMDSLEVTVDVSEKFINLIRPGQAATITLNAYKDWHIPAEVIAVVPTADRNKATVGVRLSFKENDPRILPQMGVNVSFLNEPRQPNAPKSAARGVMIPLASVVADGKRGIVFVIHDDKVEKRQVQLGERNAKTQNVVAGLSPGDKLAVAELSKLSDGALIHIKQ